MITETLKIQKKNFDTPDESRSVGRGEVQIIRLGNVSFTRATLQPGWRWSVDVRPLVHTESCQVPHAQYVVSGRLVTAMPDGSQVEVGPGDVVTIPPGHDAWVVGEDEPAVLIDFSKEMTQYAKGGK